MLWHPIMNCQWIIKKFSDSTERLEHRASEEQPLSPGLLQVEPGQHFWCVLAQMRADARSHCGFTQNTRLIMTFKHLKYQMGIMSMRCLLLERQLRKNVERQCVWCKQTATFCCVWCLEAVFLLICSCFEWDSTLLSSYSLLLCSLILFLISTVSAFFSTPAVKGQMHVRVCVQAAVSQVS